MPNDEYVIAMPPTYTAESAADLARCSRERAPNTPTVIGMSG